MNSGRRRLAGITLLGAAVLAACGSSATTTTASTKVTGSAPNGAANPSSAVAANVAITAREYSYQLPATMGSGVNNLTLTNAGTALHEFRFQRLQSGATLDDVKSAVKARDRARLATLTVAYGGVYVDPGKTARYAVDFRPGSYLVTSVETGSSGAPDIAMGMLATFTVTSIPSGGSAPTSVGTLTMRDTAYGLPVGFGRGAFHVVNNGPSIHEARLFRTDQGKTAEDVKAFLASLGGHGDLPSWLADTFGGVLDLAPGVDAWVTLDLAAAHYAVLSFVPDPVSHAPQWSEGMIADFTVS